MLVAGHSPPYGDVVNTKRNEFNSVADYIEVVEVRHIKLPWCPSFPLKCTLINCNINLLSIM